MATGVADRGAYPLLLVHVEVVHHHDLPRREGRHQDAFDVELEGRTVDRTIEEQAGTDPPGGAGGNQREVGGVVARRTTGTALTLWCTAIATSEGEIRPDSSRKTNRSAARWLATWCQMRRLGSLRSLAPIVLLFG